MTAKQTKAERRDQIMQAAIKLAAKHGYNNVTRDALAAEAGVSNGTINVYYSTMPQLRRDLMRYAVREVAPIAERGPVDKIPYRASLLSVIAQGLVMKDKHALAATDAVKKAALASLN